MFRSAMPGHGLDSADEARNASERGEQLERLSCLSNSIGTLARELAHARGLEHGAHQDDTAKREKPSDEFHNVSPCNVTSLATHWHRRADARVEDELASLCTSIEAHCRRRTPRRRNCDRVICRRRHGPPRVTAGLAAPSRASVGYGRRASPVVSSFSIAEAGAGGRVCGSPSALREDYAERRMRLPRF